MSHVAEREADGHQGADGGDDRGEQHPRQVGYSEEHQSPAGHEDQSGLWAEHPVQKDGPNDGDESESAAGSRDGCRSDAVTGPADSHASTGGRHCHRDQGESQDLDRVGNGVPHESQEADARG